MEDYDQRMKSLLQIGILSVSLTMAQETGIVDVLCHADTPLTSTQIAEKKGLKERYVRELLGALVSGRLVDLSPGTGGRDGQEAKYWVPTEHRKTLDKTGKSTSYLSVTYRQFSAVRDIFDKDGPSCARFNRHVFSMTENMAPFSFDRLVELFLSPAGLRQKLESGIDVAEIGSGKCWHIRKLAAMFPKSRFTATDVAQGPLDEGRQQAEAEGLKNLSVKLVDACDPPEDWAERFDWMFTVMTIHDVPHPQRAVNGISRALRPGGFFTMAETCLSSYVSENVGDMRAALIYTMSTLACLPESYQQADSEALGACWGEDRARRTIEASGLTLLDVTMIDPSGYSAVFICQKPE